MTLTGEQRKQLTDALISAFPTRPILKQFVKLELDMNLDVIGIGEDLQKIVLKLIENTEANGWESKLIFAASDRNPGNPKLAAFVRVYKKQYWEQLAQNANYYQVEEVDASKAIVEVQTEVVQVIESNPNINNDLMYLLEQSIFPIKRYGI